MKSLKLILLIGILALGSCDDESMLNEVDCPAELFCTEELRTLTFHARINGESAILDSHYVKNMDNGNIYQADPLNDYLDEGHYIVVSDTKKDELRKSGTTLTFFGIQNGEIVIQQDFVVGHDCCHVVPVSGPFNGLD